MRRGESQSCSEHEQTVVQSATAMAKKNRTSTLLTRIRRRLDRCLVLLVVRWFCLVSFAEIKQNDKDDKLSHIFDNNQCRSCVSVSRHKKNDSKHQRSMMKRQRISQHGFSNLLSNN